MLRTLSCLAALQLFSIPCVVAQSLHGNPAAATLDKAYWIWDDDGKAVPTLQVKNGSKRKIRRLVSLPAKPELTSATLMVAVQKTGAISFNGNPLGAVTGTHPTSFDLLPYITSGENELIVRVENEKKKDGTSPAGLAGVIYLEFDDKTTSAIVTDKTWQTGGTNLFPTYEPAREIMPYNKSQETNPTRL